MNAEQAEQALQEGAGIEGEDPQKALRLYKISLRLNPESVEAKRRLQALEARLNKGSNEGVNDDNDNDNDSGNGNGKGKDNGKDKGKGKGKENGSSHNHASTNSSSIPKKSSSRDYTKEQEEGVKRILSARSHYEVLEISSSATEDKIKRAYRLKALKFHPDKNPAPQSDDAFKKVGHAFAVLSDSQRRAHYDRFGEDDTTPPGRGGMGGMRGGMRRRRSAYEPYDEFDADEIFRQFFGGGFGGGPGVRVYHFGSGGGGMGRRGGSPRDGDHLPQAQPFNLIALLPMLILLLTFLSSGLDASSSSPFTSGKEFSLDRSFTFDTPRRTVDSHSVIGGIPYYVQSNFHRRYRESEVRKRIEPAVQNLKLQQLRSRCREETQRQRKQAAEAKSKGDMNAFQSISSRKLESCTSLDQLLNRIDTKLYAK